MRKPRTFKVDEHVGGVTVMECKTTPVLRDDWEYLVKYDCCKHSGWIKHKPLLYRIRKKAKYCGECARKATNRKNRETKAEKGFVAGVKVQMYVEGWGLTL